MNTEAERSMAWQTRFVRYAVILAVLIAVTLAVLTPVFFHPRADLERARLELAQYLHRLGSQTTHQFKDQDRAVVPPDSGDYGNGATLRPDPVIEFVTGGRSTGFYYRVIEVRLRNTEKWISPSQLDQPIPMIFPEYTFMHANRFGHVPAYHSDGTVHECVSPLVLGAIGGDDSSNELAIPISEATPYSVQIDRFRVEYLKGQVKGR
jgi:hypothetical protein